MKKYSKKDLAIVGMSGRFPQSENVNEFWQNLVGGELLTTFYSDEELIELGVDRHIYDDENFVKVTSFMEGAESFDYSFFGYTQDEAKVMDPQTRVMHEHVWLALEDANLAKSTSKNIGLYLSARDNPEWRSYAMMTNNPKVNPFFGSKLSNKNYMSTLISYSLNLKGPSYYVDTGSSSAMVAIHLACRSLLMQECSIAIAGGVSISSNNSYGYRYSEGMIYSKDGRCRTFDASSSGTVPGEGVGSVVLKRLGQAIEDKDRIYAVIKSSAVNNDGNRRAGYTTPSVQGQYECIKMAHQIAGIKPSEIAYVEAHGTGTEVGDPIEMKALNKAFASDEEHTCAIGSVKTNMGHLDKAAGVAGVIKTALALKNKMIPASLNFENPNPEIDFESGPFFVNTALKQWDNPEDKLRYAGVSSFGLGGTNAHVVLGEYEEVEQKESASRPYQLLTYSARSVSALEQYEEKLKNYLTNDSSDSLANIAYTQNIGRKDFEYRKFAVSKTKENCVGILGENTNNTLPPVIENTHKHTVFMFPGQGSQYFGMGKGLYEQEVYFRSIMDRGFELLKEETGKDYKAVIGYSDAESVDESLINDTEYTQPLLFLVEYALCKLIMKWGINPDRMIGHSLGEYVAACISGVFSFEDALKVIATRGDLMGALTRGGMVAVGAPVSVIKDILADGLSIAAVNTNDSCVISGKNESIESFLTLLAEKEIQFSKLETSHAFHSEMMEEMISSFEEKLSTISFEEPKIPFVSNLTGKEIKNTEAASKEYWVSHLRKTVRFSEGLNTLAKEESSIFVEIGPGNALTNFLKQTKEEFRSEQSAVTLLSRAKEVINDNETLTIAIGELWSLGIQIDWNAYYEEESRKKVALPTYVFDVSNLPVRAEPIDKIPILFNEKRRKLHEWFYESSWKKQNLFTEAVEEGNPQNFLIFTNENQVSTAFVEQLKKQGHSVISVLQGDAFNTLDEVTFEINPKSEEDYKALFSTFSSNKTRLDNVVYFLDNPSLEHESRNEQTAFYEVLHIAKNLHSYEEDEPIRFAVVTNNLYEITGAEQINKHGALVAGLAPVINQEYPLIKTQCIDLLAEGNSTQSATSLYKELIAKSEERVLAFRHQKRWVKTYNEIAIPVEQKNSKIKSNGVYLITGGLGNLGFTYAKYLLEKYNASLILVGRTKIGGSHDQESITKSNRLQELKSLGEVFYKEADVSDLNEMKQAISEGASLYGKINGIIHAAGIVDGVSFSPINELKQEDCKSQFVAKVEGLKVLEELFGNHEIDFCLLSSSLNSMIGGKALAAYAAANVYMDVFAQATPLQNCISVNYDKLNFFGKVNNFSLAKDEMIEVLERALSFDDSTQVIISMEDVHQKIEKWMSPTLDDDTTITKVNVERSVLTSAFASPETATEVKLIDLFQDFLGFSNIGIDDDFFELGVDSLKGVMLKNQIHKEFGVVVSLVSLFEHNTVQKLASMLDKSQMKHQMESTENSMII